MLVGSGINVAGAGQLVSTFAPEAAFANEVVQGDWCSGGFASSRRT